MFLLSTGTDSLDSINDDSTTVTAASRSSATFIPRRSVKAKRSVVWRYFKSVDDQSFDVECILCSSMVARTSTSTSNLLHHVQTRHTNEYNIIHKTIKSKTHASAQRLPLSSERSTHLNKLAADLVISNLLPLSLVESPHLQRIFPEAEPSYILPKRKYFLKNILQQLYDETRRKVQEDLNAATSMSLMLSRCFHLEFYVFRCLSDNRHMDITSESKLYNCDSSFY